MTKNDIIMGAVVGFWIVALWMVVVCILLGRIASSLNRLANVQTEYLNMKWNRP